jgi:hypothetical protein
LGAQLERTEACGFPEHKVTKQSITIRLPSERTRTRDINKYAKEIGSIAILWNQLHDDLANILGCLLPSQNPLDYLAQSVWYSTNSDYAQRQMLRSATAAHSGLPTDTKTKIVWLLNKIDHFLADKRNDAMHTPFITAASHDSTSWLLIANSVWTRSARAQKLHGKDLLSEFAWYADYTSALAMYAKAIERALIQSKPLPDKPFLPHLKPRSIRNSSSKKNTGK